MTSWQKEERPILIKEGLQVINLPAAEQQKFLKIGSEEGWEDIIQKNPQTGPELEKASYKRGLVSPGEGSMERAIMFCVRGKLCFSLPESWKVLTAEDKPFIPGVKDPISEISRALIT